MLHIYAHRNTVPKTMRAIAKVDAASGLKLIEALVPTPGPGEVLIRVKKAALSASAVHTDRWDHWAQRNISPPVIVGHEFVGLVASVGPGVADCHPGELVIGEPCVACGNCRHCLGGHRHLCPDAHRLGQDRDGAFADYVCMPQGAIWHADPRLATDLLACFAPLGQLVRIARRFDMLGAHVLISGAGALGCMATAIARHAGARSVVVVDNHTTRLGLAATLGATRGVDTREANLGSVMRDLAIRDGFDLGIETSGSPAALGDVLNHLRLGGQLALLGLPSDEALPSWGQIINKQLIVHGIDGRDNLRDWERLTLALHSGLDVTPVITHCLPVGDFREAFERSAAGDPGKMILDWES
jgi:threonine 3-dehydrogenase